MAIFIADSNFFIQAHRAHYPFDVVPSFWLKVTELHRKGILMSIDRVQDELFGNKDVLCDWIKAELDSNTFFRKTDTPKVLNSYREISKWAASNDRYLPTAIAEFLTASEADAWLIAYAHAHGGTILTHEKGDSNIKKKIKIPEPCNHFGLPFMTTIEMFRTLGERF